MSRDAFVDLVQWYLDAGVDLAVDEHPHDRFAEAELPVARTEAAAAGAPAGRQRPAPAQPIARVSAFAPATLSAEQAAEAAREQAAHAATLEELRVALEGFDGCGLKIMATQLVFAEGNASADIMLIGGTPDDEDDRAGLPFAGGAGVLLDGMLAAIGLDRTAVYITNVVPWRPPGNRTPTPTEVAVCLPFIRRHIELVDPKILVCFGDVAGGALLAQNRGIRRVRGQWTEYRMGGDNRAPRSVAAMSTLHPAFLLRAPHYKRQAWVDLQLIAAAHRAIRAAAER